MDLQSYYNDLPRGERFQLAKTIGMSPARLSQMASGYINVPPSWALAIETATAGIVTRQDILPDDWEKYWLPAELDYTARLRNEGEHP